MAKIIPKKKKKVVKPEPEKPVRKKKPVAKAPAKAAPKTITKKSRAQKPSRPSDVDTAERNEYLQFMLRKSDRGRLRVGVATFSDKDYLDVRHMYQDKDGEWLPTKKGCAMPLELARKFHRRLGKLLAKVEAEGLQTSDE